MSGLPVVAIVGRPNVGKSTLFNRILGSRRAIVEDRARTTRDRLHGEAEWNGRRFTLVDTGGLEAEPGDSIEAGVQQQARLAIGEADVIVFVVDAAAGITPADDEAAALLRRASGPVLVAVNKADNDRRDLEAAEFHQLGWEGMYAISAAHGRGTGDLLDAIVDALPPESEAEIARRQRVADADAWARDFEARQHRSARATRASLDGQGRNGHGATAAAGTGAAPGDLADADESAWQAWDESLAQEAEEPEVSIAIVGRPNVGKSSLVNSLLGEQRQIVSEIPGTTRDAIDTKLPWGRGEIVLIDTAGLRRRGKVAGGPEVERYSALRALRAIGRADVAVLVLDAADGLTAQDAHVAGYVAEEGRGLVIAVNKWDLLTEKTDRTFDEFARAIRQAVPFLDFAPVLSVSALTGQRVDRVIELAVDVWGERRRRIPTGELNRLLGDALRRQLPPAVKGRQPKIFYGTQVAVAPPTFVIFARDAARVHFSYQRYLENVLRDEFGFLGTPIRLIFRERSSVDLPGSRPGPKSRPSLRPSSSRRPPARGSGRS